MEKKSVNFSQLEQLARSEAGQQLMAYLQSKDTGQLQAASEQAAKGNYTDAARALSSLLASPEARELLKKLGG